MLFALSLLTWLIVSAWPWPIKVVINTLFAVVIAIGLLVYVGNLSSLLQLRRARLRHAASGWIDKLEQALHLVHARDVEATAVIEIGQFEDEGDGYVFDLGDNRCLLLKGQDFWPLNSDAPWPCTRFSLLRTADAGDWIGLFAAGDLLEPKAFIEPSALQQEYVWELLEEIREGTAEVVAKQLVGDRSR